ncbi:MAG: patatin-like phospholipase family protein [Elusimicrobia bacterium]|nr:patatin-like phospholipase family protein [Elusimicrobiota bacterium]
MTSFAGPLGLALSGGGAHGAWQVGALRALTDSGLEFSKVLGFSAGALSGAGYALGLQDVLEEKWRRVDQAPVLRVSPTFGPFALCKNDALWESVEHTRDEEAAKKKLRCELTVVAYREKQDESEYARFTPGGKEWDGPLALKLVASCSIPHMFPRIKLERPGQEPLVYMDGGVPGKDWIRFDALAGCPTVLALQMTHPSEIGRFCMFPWTRFEQTGREVCYRQMASGIDSLTSRPDAPAVFRLYPSKRLAMSQLAFKSKPCIEAMALGRRDAEAFLKDPEPYRVRRAVLSAPPLPVGAGRTATA